MEAGTAPVEVEEPPEHFYTKEEWLRRMEGVDLFESDVQNVVLNFLTVHGFQEAAEAFMEEAHIAPDRLQGLPLNSVGRRSEVRLALLSDQLPRATEILNELDEGILAQNPALHFRLKQQQLFKHIMEGNVDVAIEFAQTEVAPFAQERCPDMLPLLEETMGFLAFVDLTCPEAVKKAEKLAVKTSSAKAADEAILKHYDMQQESTLENLMKNLKWSQKNLEKYPGVRFPKIDELGDPKLIEPELPATQGKARRKRSIGTSILRRARVSAAQLLDKEFGTFLGSYRESGASSWQV